MADECLINGTKYPILFEVRILHHYWLDDGAFNFNRVDDEAWKERVMSSYDVHSIFNIAPVCSTEKRINGMAGIFKKTSTGFIVSFPADTVIAEDLMFEFTVTVNDPDFYNYTALTLYPRRARAFPGRDGDSVKVFRIRENVPVFSNVTGVRSADILSLSCGYQYAAGGGPVESLYLSGSGGSKKLVQVVSEETGAAVQVLSDDAAELPVFVHQGDVHQVTVPDWLSGEVLKGVELTEELPPDIEAVVRMKAARLMDGSNTLFCFTGSDGRCKIPHPVYEIHYKNRSTCWQYIDRQNGEVTFTGPEPEPLTCHYRFTKNPLLSRIRGGCAVSCIKNSSGEITKLISKVYV